jgi:hypothetical protein
MIKPASKSLPVLYYLSGGGCTFCGGLSSLLPQLKWLCTPPPYELLSPAAKR